jgi:hypothetical protein
MSADFAGREFQTIDAAKDVFHEPLLIAAGVLGFAGVLGLGFWCVVGSLNAMRVGLLTRFMGILGIIIGPAFVLGLTPIILSFWLFALAALFLGFWPRGKPPAWDAGEAIPRPSPGGREQEAVEVVGGSRDGEVEAVGAGVREPAARQEDSPRRPRARKRKRRR